MELSKTFKKVNGRTVFESAVYRLKDYPEVEIFKDPGRGWVIGKHMQSLAVYRWGIEDLPVWLRHFIEAEQPGGTKVYRTRGELIAALEAAEAGEGGNRGELGRVLAE